MKKIYTPVKVAMICGSLFLSSGSVFAQLNDSYPVEEVEEKTTTTAKATDPIKGISSKPDSVNQPEGSKLVKEDLLTREQKGSKGTTSPAKQSAEKSGEEVEKMEETKSPVSYNFFYYIIQKFRFSGFFGE